MPAEGVGTWGLYFSWGPWVERSGLPGGRLDLSIHTMKSGGLISSTAASFPGTRGAGRGRLDDKGGHQEPSHRGLRAVICGVCVYEGPVSLRPPQATWPTKRMPKQRAVEGRGCFVSVLYPE